MKTTKINTRLFLGMFLIIASMTFGTSCKKDTAKDNSGQTVLLSFGPTGAKPGDTLRFIGKNLGTVTEIKLTGSSVPKSGFIQQTAELIQIIVPKETVKGYVTLKTPQGDIVSKTKLDLDVPVMITSVTKQARPGENITITGKYLNWVNYVTFGKGVVVDSTGIVSKSMDKLVVKVPRDAQTGRLILSYGGTEPDEIETDSVLMVTLPSITSISPNPIKHADNVTITGQNLDLVWGILFNGVKDADTNFVSQSATKIVIKVAAGVKAGKVTLVAPSKVMVISNDDLTLVLPSVTGLSPNPVNPEGELTITGTNLDLASGILFNGLTVYVTTFISQSASKIVVKVPAGAKKGKVILKVANSTLTVDAPQSLTFTGDLPPLPPLGYVIYNDAFQNNWQDWGWNRTADYGNKENVREGEKSMKLTYTATWSGIKYANSSVTTASYKEVAFSIYGGVGTNGKEITVTANGNGAASKKISIKEGQWIDVVLKIADIGNPGKLTELILANADWTGTIYVDQVGLR